MRLLEAIKSASESLEKAGVADAFEDAELLVLHAAGFERLRAYIDNPETDQKTLTRIKRLTKRRIAGEPVQYITGKVDFLGLDIRVGKGVLIPRPETELLAEEAVKATSSRQSAVCSDKKNLSRFTSHVSLSFLDLCTGSGCIALVLAKESPDSQVYATDISVSALKYAKENAVNNGIRNITFLKGSLFAPLKKALTFDLITANPPYIRTSDIPGLQREVRDWEPVNALDGGPDGLDFYREIFLQAPGYLNEKGSILVELGFGQSKEVHEIAANNGLQNITVVKDFAGIDRILKAEK
jgi:release factor glutamine methyltransferase